MLKQVRMQQLEDKALVVPEMDVFLHPDDVVLVIWVFRHQELQKLGLLLGKFMINLCVPVDFYRNLFPCLVIKACYDLSE